MQQTTQLSNAQQQLLRSMEKEINALFERQHDAFLRKTDSLIAEILGRHGRQFAILLEGLLKQTFDGTTVGTAPNITRGSFAPSAIQNLSGLWQELQRAQRNL